MWPAQRCRFLWAALGVSALVSVSQPASAQSDQQRAAARSLATEGAAAFEEGRFQDSADLFGKAESLMHAPPHLLFQARSQVKLGQLVRAREAYLKVIKETLPSSAPKAFRDAQTAASNEIKEVEPKIAGLTVLVEGGDAATDVAVTVDGVALPAVLLGVPQPLDPGSHRLEAGATGLRAQPQTVTLADGEKKSVVLSLTAAPGAAPLVAAAPPAGTAPASAAPASAAAPAPTPGAPPAGDQHAGSSKSGLRIGSYIGFGVGALGLIGGTVFTLQSASKRKDADKKFTACGGDAGCTTDNPLSGEVDQLDKDAKSAGTLGIVGFALGGVGVAAGVTLFILSAGGDEQHATLEPWLGPGSAGVRGRF